MPERMRFFMGARGYFRRGLPARGCPTRGERVFSRAMKDALLDLLYPRECAGCAAGITEAGGLAFCPDGDGRLEWIGPPPAPAAGRASAGSAAASARAGTSASRGRP